MKDDWLRLFPETDYRPAMNLRVIEGQNYFATLDEARLEMRRALLNTAPEFYLGGEMDTGSLARFLGLPVMGLPQNIEPDWVLLRQVAAGAFLIEGGCVCFPTAWSLPEKIGLPLAAVHDPVPGLNTALGSKIDQFLTRLTPSIAYGRENWGLTSSDILDQHPRHLIPEIAADADRKNVWLRIEEQALVRLDDGQIVFGIRIKNLRLDQLPAPKIAPRLAHTLRTLTPEMLAYKRLTRCRDRLISLLNNA